MRKKRTLLATWFGVVLAATLTSCGSSTGAADGAKSSSFVGSAGQSVVIIEWVRHGESIDGSFHRADADDGAPSGVSETSGPVTGRVSGDTVALRLGSLELTGRISGGVLSLSLPSRSGEPVDVRLSSGRSVQFNRRLGVLRASVQRARNAYPEALGTFCSKVQEASSVVQSDASKVQGTAASDPDGAVKAIGGVLDRFATSIDDALSDLRQAAVPPEYRAFQAGATSGVEELVSKVRAAAAAASGGDASAVSGLGSTLSGVGLPDLPQDLGDRAPACARISK